MDGSKMVEFVVTDTSRPDRIGANTDRRGSVLCLTVWICKHSGQLAPCTHSGLYAGGSYLWHCAVSPRDQALVLTTSISLEVRGERRILLLGGLDRDNYIACQICDSRNCRGRVTVSKCTFSQWLNLATMRSVIGVVAGTGCQKQQLPRLENGFNGTEGERKEERTGLFGRADVNVLSLHL